MIKIGKQEQKWKKKKTKAKEEENKSIEEPDNMVVEKTSNGDNLVEANNKRYEWKRRQRNRYM